jgi:hypothetical protein
MHIRKFVVHRLCEIGERLYKIGAAVTCIFAMPCKRVVPQLHHPRARHKKDRNMFIMPNFELMLYVPPPTHTHGNISMISGLTGVPWRVRSTDTYRNSLEHLSVHAFTVGEARQDECVAQFPTIKATVATHYTHALSACARLSILFASVQCATERVAPI